MKTKTALLIAVILGLFTYTLPLYAGNTEYHIEEKTVIDIPIVGKVTTRTSTYLSGCKLKENTSIKIHNSLIKLMSDSDGISHDVMLSDLCDEVQWKYDEDKETYFSHTFAEIRKERESAEHNSETQIDMEADQNDINNSSDISHEIMGYEKNINGFRARKVVTTVRGDDLENPIIIEEYYSTKAKALTKITESREKISELKGHSENEIDGVPNFINTVYASITEDEDWKRPAGEVIRFVINVVDQDKDSVFKMTYDVNVAETVAYEEEHFTLK